MAGRSRATKALVNEAKVRLIMRHNARWLYYGDCATIAREVGLAPSTVQRLARDLGFRRLRKPNTPYWASPRPTTVPDWKPRTERSKAIGRDLMLGAPDGFYSRGMCAEIARRHGVTRSRVQQIARQLRMELAESPKVTVESVA